MVHIIGINGKFDFMVLEEWGFLKFFLCVCKSFRSSSAVMLCQCLRVLHICNFSKAQTCFYLAVSEVTLMLPHYFTGLIYSHRVPSL